MNGIVLKKLKPMLNHIITTANAFTEDELTSESGLIEVSRLNQIKDMQTIVAVSENAANRGLKVGDIVLLNFNKSQYSRVIQSRDIADNNKHNAQIEYTFPMLEIDGVEYLNMNAEDVEYIVEEYEVVKAPPKKKLLLPNKGLIVGKA
ncbi:MAG: hypothetical protein LBE56_12400 [Tannerella sp.]|jgi:co-chaperonin GroES (HSP10)|nr:hypothetical protein [Tannerella sp.]